MKECGYNINSCSNMCIAMDHYLTFDQLQIQKLNRMYKGQNKGKQRNKGIRIVYSVWTRTEMGPPTLPCHVNVVHF